MKNNKIENNKLEQNNLEDLNLEDNKIEESNLEQISFKNEGKEIELEDQIIFRRVFGKKLAMISLIDNSLSKMIECITHDPTIIKQLIIGDIIKLKGKISYTKKKAKNKYFKYNIFKKKEIYKNI